MSDKEIEFISGLSLEEIKNFLKNSKKKVYVTIGYCRSGTFVGEKIYFKKFPLFLNDILEMETIDHVVLSKIIEITNDIYIIETPFLIYIVSYKSFAYCLNKPLVNNTLDIITLCPTSEKKNIIVQDSHNLVDNIYVIITPNNEQFLLLSYL